MKSTNTYDPTQVAKRFYQLTGNAIPDAKLLQITNVRSLIETVTKPPPPTKVYEAVTQSGELDSLPNVTVHARRRTPVDKAVDLGRWKVVEQELEKRGLPVLGKDHDVADKYRKKEWFRGPLPAFRFSKGGKGGRKSKRH